MFKVAEKSIDRCSQICLNCGHNYGRHYGLDCPEEPRIPLSEANQAIKEALEVSQIITRPTSEHVALLLESVKAVKKAVKGTGQATMGDDAVYWAFDRLFETAEHFETQAHGGVKWEKLL